MSKTMPAPVAAKLEEAKKMLAKLGGCALLVGVETYDGFPADKQLLAGRNDVLCYWKMCRRLGYRPEHIRVLTSPRLAQADILQAEKLLGPELHPKKSEAEIEALVAGWFSGEQPKVVLGEATRDALIEGVRWLAARLVFTVKLDWEGFRLERELASLPGFFAYSGHGARVEGDLALCPRDVGEQLSKAIPFGELRALIDAGDDIRVEGTPHPADNLTVVLDCCFASAGNAGKAFRVPTLTAGEGGKAHAPREIGSRVFSASGRDEQAYQGMLGGHWHGAFTWAFTRALEQWKTTPSGHTGQFKKSTVSHAELLFRARMLLEALSFPQHPVLVDGIGNLPVFQHDSDASDETSAEPDAERRGIQLDPSERSAFTVMALKDRIGAPIAVGILVHDNSSNPSFTNGNEYWYAFPGNYRSFSTEGKTDLSLERILYGYAPYEANKAHLVVSQRATWSPNSRSPDVLSTYKTPDQRVISFGLSLNYTSDSSDKVTSFNITWYKSESSNLFTGVDDGDYPLGNRLPGDAPAISSSASNSLPT